MSKHVRFAEDQQQDENKPNTPRRASTAKPLTVKNSKNSAASRFTPVDLKTRARRPVAASAPRPRRQHQAPTSASRSGRAGRPSHRFTPQHLGPRSRATQDSAQLQRMLAF